MCLFKSHCGESQPYLGWGDKEDPFLCREGMVLGGPPSPPPPSEGLVLVDVCVCPWPQRGSGALFPSVKRELRLDESRVLPWQL